MKSLEKEFDLNDMKFELIDDENEVFDKEKFQEYYTEVLDKYDFIVGDFADENLRLCGFYKSKDKQGFEKSFEYIEYYIHAFCILGAPYYIVQNKKPKEVDLNEIKEEEKNFINIKKAKNKNRNKRNKNKNVPNQNKS